MKFINFNDEDPRLTQMYFDNSELKKENKKLKSKVRSLEKRLNEIESQFVECKLQSDVIPDDIRHSNEKQPIVNFDDDFRDSDHYVPENDVNIYIIIALLIMFIVIMIVAILQGGVAL